MKSFTPGEVLSVVRMGFLPFPVTVVPSRGMTPTFNTGFCEALGHTRASGEDHTWRGRKPKLGGRGDNGELMALLSQRVKNERMRPFSHLQTSSLKGLYGHQRCLKGPRLVKRCGCVQSSAGPERPRTQINDSNCGQMWREGRSCTAFGTQV